MPNLKKKKTPKETARRPGGNSGTRRRENSGAAALEKRRRKPRVSWPPRCALLPGEGPAQDPAQPVGPARGACEPGGHTPARPGWGGRQATFLSLCKATARITPAPRARAHAGLSNIFGSVVNFSRETCALRARCQGEELRPGGGPRPSTPRCERFGNAAPPRRARSQSSAEAAIGSGTVRQPRPGQNQTRTSCPSPRRGQRFGLLSIIRKRSKTQS